MAVMGLRIEGASYPVAIKILKSEFGNERAVKESLYNELQYLKPPSESDQDLCRFVDQMERIFLQLIQTGENIDNIQNETTILKKLPVSLVTKLQEFKNRSAAWSLSLLRKNLKELLQVREETSRIVSQGRFERNGQKTPPPAVINRRGNKQPVPNTYNDFGEKPHTLTFNTVETGKDKVVKPQYPCMMCQSPRHFAADCTEFKSKSRIRFLQIAERCQRCLLRGHLTTECPTPKICTNCSGMHV